MHKITAHKCNAAAAAAQVCSQPAMRPAKAANLMKIASMATLLALLCSVILARIKSNFALLVFRVASKHTHTHIGTHSHTPIAICVHFNRCKSFKFIILCRAAMASVAQQASKLLHKSTLPATQQGWQRGQRGCGTNYVKCPLAARTVWCIECSLRMRVHAAPIIIMHHAL